MAVTLGLSRMFECLRHVCSSRISSRSEPCKGSLPRRPYWPKARFTSRRIRALTSPIRKPFPDGSTKVKYRPRTVLRFAVRSSPRVPIPLRQHPVWSRTSSTRMALSASTFDTTILTGPLGLPTDPNAIPGPQGANAFRRNSKMDARSAFCPAPLRPRSVTSTAMLRPTTGAVSSRVPALRTSFIAGGERSRRAFTGPSTACDPRNTESTRPVNPQDASKVLAFSSTSSVPRATNSRAKQPRGPRANRSNSPTAPPRRTYGPSPLTPPSLHHRPPRPLQD